MKHKLLDILACPNDGYFPLDLHVFDEDDEIMAGILVCPKCSRWYPIRGKLPEMFPDEMRDKLDELSFLHKWEEIFPQKILKKGKPFNLSTNHKTKNIY